MINIKELLDSEEYSFLKEDELDKKTAFLTLAGSISYGTDISNENYQSDVDIRGVYLHTREEILTCRPTDETIGSKDADILLYPLCKIVHLLKNCNPDVIPLLGVKKEHILKMSPEGKLLIDNADLFLSKRAGNSFGGYAMQQLSLIEQALMTEGCADEEALTRRLKHRLEKQMEHFALTYTGLSKDECFKISSRDSSSRDELSITVDLREYPVKSLRGMFSELSNIEKDFGKLTKRNKKSTPAKLAKHQMHLIRLLSMGTEILSGEGINTFREKDRDFLLDIRNEKYTNEEIMEFARQKEAEFNYAKKHTCLPDNCDYKAIDDLVCEINLMSMQK